jgi:hypothetical protein
MAIRIDTTNNSHETIRMIIPQDNDNLPQKVFKTVALILFGAINLPLAFITDVVKTIRRNAQDETKIQALEELYLKASKDVKLMSKHIKTLNNEHHVIPANFLRVAGKILIIGAFFLKQHPLVTCFALGVNAMVTPSASYLATSFIYSSDDKVNKSLYAKIDLIGEELSQNASQIQNKDHFLIRQVNHEVEKWKVFTGKPPCKPYKLSF